MRLRLYPIVTIALLLVGCTAPKAGDLSWGDKRDLMKRVSAHFDMPKGHETEVYGILRAVREQLPPDKVVVAITFHPVQGVTVYFEAHPKSLHGGPLATATRDGAKWKIGELWWIM